MIVKMTCDSTMWRAFAIAAAFMLAGCGVEPTPSAGDFPEALTVDREGEAWIRQTLRELTTEQKVGQLFSVVAPGTYESSSDPGFRAIRDAVVDLQAGSLTFLASSPMDQAALTNELQAMSNIPLLVGQDMEFGAGMRVEGATRIPAAMAVAAAGDPRLAYRAGVATAEEARALGVHLVYAPVADVNSNPVNPVIGTRSYSDDPALASQFLTAFIHGLQEAGVMATAKHFPGHGDSRSDSHVSLPVLDADAARLDSVELPTFRAALAAHAAAVMTGHLALPAIDSVSDRPASLSPVLTGRWLRDSLGFGGLVVTDALNMVGAAGYGTTGQVAVRAFLAGNDLLLMSPDPYEAREDLLAAVETGRISEARLNASVARILRAKAAVGLHRTRSVDVNRIRDRVGAPANKTLADEIARRAVTALDGSFESLTGRPGERVLLVLLGTSEASSRPRVLLNELREAIAENDLEIMSLPSAPGPATRASVFRAAERADAVIFASFLPSPRSAASATPWSTLVRSVAAVESSTTVIALTSPYVLREMEGTAAALLATFDDAAPSQRAAALALTGRASITGHSPITLSSTLPQGTGLQIAARYPREGRPEEVGMEGTALLRVDSLLRRAVHAHAFPGAAVAVGRKDVVVELNGFGFFGYDDRTPVTAQSVFDLASLTKVIATTTAIAQLWEAGKVRLSDPVADYVPEFGQGGKDSVTVHHLLTHTGGLIPFRSFYQEGLRTRREVMEAIYNEELIYEPGTESRYSDFGPIMLAELVSRVSGQSFADYVREHITRPLGMWNTGFRGTGLPDPRVVPTEVDDYFRNRLIQGEVHDENAWILGGTAGHAGLFSTAEDLSRFASMLVNDGRVGDRAFLDPGTIEIFSTPVDPEREHTRALGWDTRSPEGYSSAGQFFGPRSFGHTGFTGTSLWIDPDADLFVILLTNRVHPSRANRGHIPIRPALADLVHETLRSPRPEPLLPAIAD